MFSVPFPVDIPNIKNKQPPRVSPSLYKDLFGSDLSIVAEFYDAPWISQDMKDLAVKLLDGQKFIGDLQTTELNLLDDLVIRVNNQKGCRTVIQPTHKQAVPDEDIQDEDQEMQYGEESDLQSEGPSNVAGAYGWLSGEGSK
jgi:hypothetical protein